MLNFLIGNRNVQGYKITDNKRSRKYGIAANSLKMLMEKAKTKFPITDLCVYLASDGCEVNDEDYFATIPPQTGFIIASANTIITTDSDYRFEKFREIAPSLQVADIMYNFIEKYPAKFGRMIEEYEKQNTENLIDKTIFSTRIEHSEWFQGQEDRFSTKEEAMEKRAQDRIRSYYYKTKDELTGTLLYRKTVKGRDIIDGILKKFRYLLIGCNYFSMIFNRSFELKHSSILKKDETDSASLPNKRIRQMIKDYSQEKTLLTEWSVSLCTNLGEFYCQGPHSQKDNCSKSHMINPYASREALILFQVWNLDHQIELARSILPSLISNVQYLVDNGNQKCPLHNRDVVDVSVLEYFLEIFSVKNLNLVHIVCHEKVHRNNKSNGRLVCDHCSDFKTMKDIQEIVDNN